MSIWMSEVRCYWVNNVYSFWPQRLTSCPFWGMEDANCTYGMVTGVECTDAPDGFGFGATPCKLVGVGSVVLRCCVWVAGCGFRLRFRTEARVRRRGVR